MAVRERIQERQPARGRRLFEVPGYTFRIFVTNLADPKEEIWRDYHQRACLEQRNFLFDNLLLYAIPTSRKLAIEPQAAG